MSGRRRAGQRRCPGGRAAALPVSAPASEPAGLGAPGNKARRAGARRPPVLPGATRGPPRPVRKHRPTPPGLPGPSRPDLTRGAGGGGWGSAGCSGGCQPRAGFGASGEVTPGSGPVLGLGPGRGGGVGAQSRAQAWGFQAAGPGPVRRSSSSGGSGGKVTPGVWGRREGAKGFHSSKAGSPARLGGSGTESGGQTRAKPHKVRVFRA